MPRVCAYASEVYGSLLVFYILQVVCVDTNTVRLAGVPRSNGNLGPHPPCHELTQHFCAHQRCLRVSGSHLQVCI